MPRQYPRSTKLCYHWISEMCIHESFHLLANTQLWQTANLDPTITSSAQKRSYSSVRITMANGYSTPSDDDSAGTVSPVEVENREAPGKQDSMAHANTI
jgi:hypothetical protein